MTPLFPNEEPGGPTWTSTGFALYTVSSALACPSLSQVLTTQNPQAALSSKSLQQLSRTAPLSHNTVIDGETRPIDSTILWNSGETHWEYNTIQEDTEDFLL